MKTNVILIFAAAIFAGGCFGFTGCRTVTYSELSPTGSIPNLLPPLEAEVDMWSFESAFGATITSGSVSDSGYWEGVTYANPMLRDIITVYQRDMRNITQEYGLTRGTAICELVSGRVGGGGFGWAFFSGLTLFIPNLLGMPFAYARADIQLEMSVLDARGVLVGRYTSDHHRRRVPVALYYGYGSDAALKVAVDTFKACMTDIKKQIELDFNRLNGALTVTMDVPARSPEARDSDGSVATGTTQEPVLRKEW